MHNHVDIIMHWKNVGFSHPVERSIDSSKQDRLDPYIAPVSVPKISSTLVHNYVDMII